MLGHRLVVVSMLGHRLVVGSGLTRKLPERRSIQEDTKPVGQEAGSKPNLLPNPTPHQHTISFQPPTGHSHIGFGESATANQSVITIIPQSSVHPKTDRLLIDISNKLGPPNRDELRLAATFNYSRVMRYLDLVDDVFRALAKLTRGNGEVGYS